MRTKNHWHPCFLPDYYRNKLKAYQADLDRNIDRQEIRDASDGGNDLGEAAEINDQELGNPII